MNRYLYILVTVAVLLQIPATARAFDGVYVADLDGSKMVLELKTASKVKFTGSMSMLGISSPVQAQVKGSALEGTINIEGMVVRFRAQKEGDKLSVTMFEPGTGEAETLVFSKTAKSVKKGAAKGKIVINGKALSAKQIKGLVSKYKVKPVPGNYWYDGKCGLYGVVGYGSFGFMLPGHRFGKLSGDVSSGNTGVFVNGRELPQNEWLVWSNLLGAPIQRGSYWLDAKGNAGIVGNPVPTVNLYAAAQANKYRHQGGGRGADNFWSTRFSAGNSDSGGSRGYVSVPGHGPVGYGF